MVFRLFLMIMAFGALWFASEMMIEVVLVLSKKLGLSAFVLSFLILGLVMSLPEITVGVNSLLLNQPEVFVGDELGSSIGIFLLVIPVLAILGNGIVLTGKLLGEKLLLSLLVVLVPYVLILDREINLFDSFVCVLSYFLLFFQIRGKKKISRNKMEGWWWLKVVFGIMVVFLSGNILVEQTKYFSDFLGISTFWVSFLLLSFGTSLPEFFVMIRSLVKGRKEVAFGGYVGSAAANTLILGVMSGLNGKLVLSDGIFVLMFIVFALGLLLTFFFIRSKDDISRKEGVILLLLYLFLIFFKMVFLVG